MSELTKCFLVFAIIIIIIIIIKNFERDICSSYYLACIAVIFVGKYVSEQAAKPRKRVAKPREKTPAWIRGLFDPPPFITLLLVLTAC